MIDSEYRLGIEDALVHTQALWDALTRPASLSEVLKDVRKSLLTKKVTRWANVYSDGRKVSVAPVTFDTEQGARSAASPNGVPTNILGAPVGFYQKSVPIEIEIPL
jgi:hypothetical protein